MGFTKGNNYGKGRPKNSPKLSLEELKFLKVIAEKLES
jgi:hypothetical protein